MSLIPSRFYLDDFFDDLDTLEMPKMPRMDMKCDIYEKGGKTHIEMDVPGYKKEDIKIDLEDGILTVVATRKAEEEEKDKKYVRKERVYGSFKRQFEVKNIKEEDIEAEFHNGVLKIRFPKVSKKDTKKFIEIK